AEGALDVDLSIQLTGVDQATGATYLRRVETTLRAEPGHVQVLGGPLHAGRAAEGAARPAATGRYVIEVLPVLEGATLVRLDLTCHIGMGSELRTHRSTLWVEFGEPTEVASKVESERLLLAVRVAPAAESSASSSA